MKESGLWNRQKQWEMHMELNLLVITFYKNNAVQRQRLADWIKKYNSELFTKGIF